MAEIKKRIVLLTQWFDPEPTVKGLAFARELVRHGFDVEVVTGFPNYPGGKLYPGYSVKFLQRQTIEGISVTRLPLYPSHDNSVLRRILNYASFAASSLLYGLLIMKRPDIMYVYHPPLTVGVAAAILRFFRRIPVVLDIQDMWPDTLRASGMLCNARLLSLISSSCNWVYERADHIVVLSPGFKRLLVERGVPPKKVEVIYNWCDEVALESAALQVSEVLDKQRFCVVFAGNIGNAQALHAILAAAEILEKTAPSVCFVIVGAGIALEGLKKQALERSLKNVSFMPRLAMTEIGPILRAADALLVHLKNVPLFSVTIPSKTQAYMAVGRPIVMAVDGDSARLIEQAQCGVIATPEDPESIAKAVAQLASLGESERTKMAMNGKKFYAEHMSLAAGVARFCKCFATVAS